MALSHKSMSILKNETRKPEDIADNEYYAIIYIELSKNRAPVKINGEIRFAFNPLSSVEDNKTHVLFSGTSNHIAAMIKRDPSFADTIIVESKLLQFLPLREAVRYFRARYPAFSS
jgi:hypothetical protein